MKFDEICARFSKNNPSFEDIAQIIDDDDFNLATETGLNYAKEEGYVNFDNAPFCIDLAKSSQTKIVIEDGVKPLILYLHKKAIQQSDTKKTKGDYYEASFCLVGEEVDGKINIHDAFWDDSGYVPNKKSDPDNYSYDFWRFDDNVTIASKKFNDLIAKTCESANQDSKLVLIHGHTHPQNNKYGKINNYASRSDIVASVEEAVDYYNQENGKCLFLNAIMTADGDLNIFGYDVDKEKFFIFDKVSYLSGDKIKAYTEGNYPLVAKISKKDDN